MSDQAPAPGSQGSGPRDPEPLTHLLRRLFGERTVPEIALPGHDELTRDPDDPESTRSFGRYELRGELARGGMGAILRVFDKDLRRGLAMKVILGRGEPEDGGTPRVDDAQLARFLEEAQVTGQLDHPSVVPVHELGIDPSGRVYFTMKLVKGETLRDVFDKVRVGRDGWNRTRALGVLLKVCEAMAYAHDKGVIHRDLKPANVMVGKYGEVYVMDWGLARVLGEEDKKDVRIRPPAGLTSELRSPRAEHRGDTPDSPLYTMDGDVVGTPAYMPPEQAAGDVARMGPHSDVYAVGAMLYHLLAGHMPYLPQGAVAHNYAVWHRVQEGPPASIAQVAPDAPGEIAAICERAMARGIGQRYRDMEELASDLRAFLEGRVVAAYETGTWAETRKWVQRNRALAGSLLAAVSILVAGTALALLLKAEAEREARTAEERRTAAESSERLARQREAEADVAKQSARWTAYVASILGADAAARLHAASEIARHLDSAPEEHRGWEWRRLDSLRDQSLHVLNGELRDFRFSSDGSRLLIEYRNRSTLLWNVRSGVPVATLEGGTSSFSADGSIVVTVLPDCTVRLWDASSGAARHVLRGHSDDAVAAAFNADGSLLATWSADQAARIWSTRSGALVAVLSGHTERISDCTFSPDGSRVLTASGDHTARVWDPWSGTPVTVLRGHKDGVTGATFNSTGSRILTKSQDSTVRLWHAGSGDPIAVILVQDTWDCSFSPDGSRVLTHDGTRAFLWDATTGRRLKELDRRAGQIIECAFSPDGEHLLISSEKTAELWDTASGQRTAVLQGHTSTLYSCAFSPDGTRIVTTSYDQSARVWDAATGMELTALTGHFGGVGVGAFSPDGSYVLTAGDDAVRLWDAEMPAEYTALRGHDYGATACTFSPNGSRVLTASWDGTAHVWNASSGAELTVLRGHTEHVPCAIYSADGSRILTTSWDRTARLWDAASGVELFVLRGHSDFVWSGDFSPDGSRVLTISSDGTARLWDSTSGAEVAILQAHDGALLNCAFSPDGTRVLTASVQGTAKIMDAANGVALAVLAGHGDRVWDCAFSPDGTRVLTASHDQTARIWDATSGAPLAVLGGHTDRLRCCVFSPDGSRILTCSDDATARVWDPSSGTELAVMRGHTGEIWACCFSPDGKRVLTASEDFTARVWDTATGAELSVLRGHSLPVVACAFSADGTRVLTASEDGTAIVWDSVPYRERWAARQEYAAGQASARAALERGFDGASSLPEVGRTLGGDPLLDESTRQAALDLLLLSASTVRSHVDGLGLDAIDGERVEASLQALAVHARLREYGRQHAGRLRNDPEWLLGKAWEIAKSPEAASTDLVRAHHAVRLARDLRPGDTRSLAVLGAVQYRQGHVGEAAESLRQARAARGDRHGILAFLAMAEHGLGNHAVAAEVLQRLHEFGTEEASEALQREAEALITPAEPTSW